MDEGAIITALLSIITYLVRELGKRDAAIEAMTKTQDASNEKKLAIADLVPGLQAENEELRRRAAR